MPISPRGIRLWKKQEQILFFEVYEILNPLIHDSWRTRDSFMSLYPQNDPLHYAVFDIWTQRSLEKTNEINERYNLLEKD